MAIKIKNPTNLDNYHLGMLLFVHGAPDSESKSGWTYPSKDWIWKNVTGGTKKLFMNRTLEDDWVGKREAAKKQKQELADAKMHEEIVDKSFDVNSFIYQETLETMLEIVCKEESRRPESV